MCSSFECIDDQAVAGQTHHRRAALHRGGQRHIGGAVDAGDGNQLRVHAGGENARLAVALRTGQRTPAQRRIDVDVAVGDDFRAVAHQRQHHQIAITRIDLLARGEPATPGLHNDPALAAWLDALNRLVPNGVGLSTADLNFDGLARLVASIIYFASAQHEIAGGFLWNYQLWTHRQPVRVYASGQPEPIDVYQRLVNANYNLNVKRRALISDFSGLALDSQGAASMQRFCLRLEALQTAMESEPWAVWKLYPRALKVNINA